MSNAKVRHRRRRRNRTAQPQAASPYARKFTPEEIARAEALIEELPRIPVSPRPVARLSRNAVAVLALAATLGVRL
jgi:DNA-directed RNA polymerase subunit F